MLGQIPGHFKANTFWLIIALAPMTYYITDKANATVGVVLLVVGSFLADQATHLAQADHSALPPTAIERGMQMHRWFFVHTGNLIAVFGAWIAFIR